MIPAKPADWKRVEGKPRASGDDPLAGLDR